MKTLKEVLADEEKYFISLSKLTGKQVKDIQITLSKEHGDFSIKPFRIEFTDGTSSFVEGEHDHPYLDSMLGVSDEQATALREEMDQ